MHILNIFFNDIFVGILKYDDENEQFNLEYDDTWVQSGFPISPKLDFYNNFTSKDIKNYIENLLPEGEGLDSFVKFVHLSKNNKYGLLKAIGNETSGALSFIIGKTTDIKTSFREISYEELSERIKNKDDIPIFIWDEKPRLSVAGVQAKLPICKIGDKYGLGEGKLCSTHILKFENGNHNLVLNEYLSLKLAGIAGLDIPNIEIVEFDGELVLEVERFDRKIISKSEIRKLHVIDSCQALSLPASYKYERNFGSQRDVKDIREGVSFVKLKKLLLETKIPVLSINKILQWAIFNLIIGNSDAHGKNISFFIDEKGITITPFYDILNILIYKGKFHTELAMAIDDEFIIEDIKSFDIASFCYELQTTPANANTEFKKMSKKILETLSKSDLITEAIKYNNDFVLQYIKDIEHRINYLKEHFELAKSIKKDEL